MYGVTITKGLQDWQIIQQENGFGKITLEGFYERQNPGEYAKVFVRIVREDSGEPVLFWQEAAPGREPGSWQIVLEQIPAGGLYRVESCLKETAETPYEWALRGDCREHFGVGDLYVIAGQSNAVGYGKDIVYDPPALGVHLFRNNDRWDLAAHPLNDSTGTRHEVNMEPVNTGNSPYLSMAKTILRRTGCPVGLIQTALGGSPFARWNPKETGDLYRNMVERIQSQGGRVRGILWYQGCADTNSREDAFSYEERFCGMVRTLRKELDSPKLPIFTVQLSRYLCAPVSEEENAAWSVIREAQRQAAAKMEQVYVLPAIDGTLSDMIHNSADFNLALGERLARQVLSEVYHQPGMSGAADLVSLKAPEPGTLLLEFAPVYDRLYAAEMEADELPFSVRDEAGEVRVTGYHFPQRDQISLSLERPLKGEVCVQAYAGQNPRCRCVFDFATHTPVLGFTETFQMK